jgi:hypothetical protein
MTTPKDMFPSNEDQVLNFGSVTPLVRKKSAPDVLSLEVPGHGSIPSFVQHVLDEVHSILLTPLDAIHETMFTLVPTNGPTPTESSRTEPSSTVNNIISIQQSPRWGRAG